MSEIDPRNIKESLKNAAYAAKLLRLHEERARQTGPGGLMNFIRYMWPVLEPGRKFVDGWALAAIAEHLEAVERNELPRLLVTVPPGFMKSLMINVWFMCWLWGPQNKPHLRSLSFSYAAHLTERDNEKCRTLINSRPYQELWGGRFKLSSDSKIKISNDHQGWLLASSVGGVSTGERGDIIRLDDPHNAIQGESERVRGETVRWFNESMQNRLNDMEKGSIIVVHQRLHETDVAGSIIEDPEGRGYEHLCIPMRFEVEGPWSSSTCIGWQDPRTVEGELAWPERFPAQVVDNLERDLGPFGFAAQYQQNPAPRGGGIIKRNWFRLWEDKNNKFPPFINVVAAVDPAYTEKDENDPSAMAIFATFRHPETNEFGIMLVHCWRKRLPIHGDTSPRFPGESAKAYERRCGDDWGLVEWIWHCCEAYGVHQLIIEGKASGLSVFQEIERRQSLRSWACEIDTGKNAGDKVNRLTSVQPIFSQGLMWAPDRDWADMYLAELTNFPKGKYDDLCFVAGTKITTKRGDIPIENVTTLDQVLTPFGWKSVKFAGYTGHRIVVETGILRGTYDHPVFTLDKGFATLDSITIWSRISRLKFCDLIKIIRLSMLSLTECSTEEWAAREDIISLRPKTTRSASEPKGFTSLFGSTILGRLCQRVTRSIILTTIPLIASLKIWTAYQKAIIAACLRTAIQKKILLILQQFARLRRLGMHPQRVVNGTEGMLPSLFTNLATNDPLLKSLESLTVSGVGGNSSAALPETRFVLWRVLTQNQSLNEAKGDHSREYTIAKIAVNDLSASVLARDFAANHVKVRNIMQPVEAVYNLSVEGSPCYYANGILVHNCDCTSSALRKMREMGLIQHTDEREYDEYVEQNRPQALQPLYPV